MASSPEKIGSFFLDFDFSFNKASTADFPTQTTKGMQIKKRTIEHPSLMKATKKNGNMPKSIIGNFLKLMPHYIGLYSERQEYERIWTMIKGWIKRRIDINREHLKIVFGGDSLVHYENCRVLRQMIDEFGMEMIGEDTKVENSLSYLVCLEKYVFRLGNPELTGRIQSR